MRFGDIPVPMRSVIASRLDVLEFDNRFTRELPADPETENARRQIRHACFSRVSPTPVTRPELVAFSEEVAALLGLTAEDCQSQTFSEVFTGNLVLPGMDPHATCYGGHQFGSWAGQLGDGRARTDLSPWTRSALSIAENRSNTFP